jgi:adenosylcobyric acid synthase
MSLNSWITTDGKEIGIAQAIQAMAAGVEPTAEMNPVLLKPKGDRVSQVILMGKPYADKSAGSYYDSIEETHDVLRQALETLGNNYEVIVMEGAGGAAEINLYERDIVNLGTARITNAPIILVGDIERGGVFASLYGTIQLLPADVRQNVRGMIINKFRGDPAILQAGVEELEQITGIPVLGVMPYSKLGIPSEDSVSIGDKSSPSGMYDVDVAVIRLPRISNFTDFEPLERLVNIRYVDLDEKLGMPDAIIIPGTKNTISDLQDLLDSGMAEKIQSLYRKVPILGICGGYQMLGKQIEDAAIEGESDATYEGLGLLDIHTIFDAYKKKTVQVTKKVNRASPLFDSIKGETISGYEIHMGDTGSTAPVFGDDGCVDESGIVVGTYLHGLFSNANIRKAFVSYLLEKKGIKYNEEDLEDDPYEELAQLMEEFLDIETIYSILDMEKN